MICEDQQAEISILQEQRKRMDSSIEILEYDMKWLQKITKTEG